MLLKQEKDVSMLLKQEKHVT